MSKKVTKKQTFEFKQTNKLEKFDLPWLTLTHVSLRWQWIDIEKTVTSDGD